MDDLFDPLHELSKLFDDVWPIGEGGFSVVFHGRERPTGASVVIKLLKRDAPWEREAAMLTYVRDHTAYPIGRVDLLRIGRSGVAFIFDWAGKDWEVLSDLTDELSSEEIATLTAELFSAVALLHEAGVFHRDIKPSNILFNRVLGKARLIDFGLACRSQDGSVGCVAEKPEGTLSYIPPRLFRKGIQQNAETARLQDRWSVSSTIYSVVVDMQLYEVIGRITVEKIGRTTARILERALSAPAWVDWVQQCPGPAALVEAVLMEGV